jgi:hypothetical protein
MAQVKILISLVYICSTGCSLQNQMSSANRLVVDTEGSKKISKDSDAEASAEQNAGTAKEDSGEVPISQEKSAALPKGGEPESNQQTESTVSVRNFFGIVYSENLKGQPITEVKVGSKEIKDASVYVYSDVFTQPKLIGGFCSAEVQKEIHFYTPAGLKKLNPGSVVSIENYLDGIDFYLSTRIQLNSEYFNVPIADAWVVKQECSYITVTTEKLELYLDRELRVLGCTLESGAQITKLRGVNEFEAWSAGNPARKCKGFANENSVKTARKALVDLNQVKMKSVNVSDSQFTSLTNSYYGTYCSGTAKSDFEWNQYDVEKFNISRGTKFLVYPLGTDTKNWSAKAIHNGQVIGAKFTDLPAASYELNNCSPETLSLSYRTPDLFVSKKAIEVVNGKATTKACKLPESVGFAQAVLSKKTVRFTPTGSFSRDFDLLKFEDWVSKLCGFSEGIIVIDE